MITNFKAAAPPRVQEAVKRTVLRCIGSIQDSLVEDSHRTTGVFAFVVLRFVRALLPPRAYRPTGPLARSLASRHAPHSTNSSLPPTQSQASSSRTCCTRRR